LRTAWAALVLVTAAFVPALAEDNSGFPGKRPANWRGTTHVVVDTPIEQFTPKGAEISPYIYLNRCSGGCTIKAGSINDARTDTSTIPKMGAGCPGYPNCVVDEYENVAGETGAAADAEWAELVQ